MRSIVPLSLALTLVACDPTGIAIDDAANGNTPPSDTSGSDVTDTDPSSTDDTALPIDTDGGHGGPPTPSALTVADLAKEGPFSFSLNQGTQRITETCPTGLFSSAPELDFTVANPGSRPVSDLVVVFVHGFARSRANMVGWARHLGSHGFQAATVNLCTSSPLNINHPKNGKALAEFVEARFPTRQVLLVGYSAGGLASLLAGTQASNVVGVFGLDMVDNDGGAIPGLGGGDLIGATAAPDLDVPFWGIRGEPSLCNSDGNGVDAYAAASDARLLKLNGAGHCDFERPRNAGQPQCTLGCPNPQSRFTVEERVDTLAAMVTAYAMKLGGVAGADAFWTEGQEPFNTLTAQNGPLTEQGL